MSIDRELPRTLRRPGLLRAVSRPQPAEPVTADADPRPWRVLAPADAVVLGARSLRGRLRLAPGTPVVLVADRPWGRAHLRRTAARAGVVVDRELIAVPSTRSPLVVLDEDDASIALFWSAVAMVPPGLTHALAPATLILRVMTHAPAALTRQLAPGRLLIGHTR